MCLEVKGKQKLEWLTERAVLHSQAAVRSQSVNCYPNHFEDMVFLCCCLTCTWEGRIKYVSESGGIAQDTMPINRQSIGHKLGPMCRFLDVLVL